MSKTNRKLKPVTEGTETPKESKQDKLVRLANHRVTVACKRIALIGNLAAYKPTPEQVLVIMTALAESCQRVENRLQGIRQESVTFTLNK